ncbi:MAG: RNA methyltransferase [Candidatus Moraniibacteriota bacterium]|nr:MAG: RNA methyltransferase [Candidatus Moranbacteria bacterium]
MKKNFYLILHNIRSAYNVGAIFRTADGAGVDHVYLTGYTPTPPDGTRAYTTKPERMIIKTALSAHEHVSWSKYDDIDDVFSDIRKKGDVSIVALEQGEYSINYKQYVTDKNIALILGNEPVGIDEETLAKCDTMIDIPMRGSKKSLNVSVAAGIAMYELIDKVKF